MAKDARGDPPQFVDPDMFLFWKKRFEVFAKTNYPYLWKYIESAEDTSSCPYAKYQDDLAINLLYRAIPDKLFGIILKCQTAHDIWRTLVMTYGGDSKIDSLTQEFETFKMLPGESIRMMLSRYNLIISSLKKLGVSYSTEKYVAKVLSGLPSDWNDVVKTTIREHTDFCLLSLDDLFEPLRTCETRIVRSDHH